MRQIIVFLASTGIGFAAGLAAAQQAGGVDDVPRHVMDAVDQPERPAADRARDAERKPAQILAMSGAGPGDHVVEFAGFGQYYTRMLAAIVGPNGRVDVYDLPYTEAFAGEAVFDEEIGGRTDRAVFVFEKPE